MKECDKRNSHISSKLHMIYMSSNNNDEQDMIIMYVGLHVKYPIFLSGINKI